MSYNAGLTILIMLGAVFLAAFVRLLVPGLTNDASLAIVAINLSALALSRKESK